MLVSDLRNLYALVSTDLWTGWLANLPSDRVQGPVTLHCQAPQLESLGVDRTTGRGEVVLVAANVKHGWAKTEHGSGKQEGQPESNVSLCVNHGDLTGQGSNVDHQVEVQVDTSHCRRWVHNHALPTGERRDIGLRLAVLFRDQRRNVGLETTCTHTHDDQTDSESSDRSIRTGDNLGDGRNNQDGVTNQCASNGGENGAESTPVLIGNPSTGQGHNVGPEGID